MTFVRGGPIISDIENTSFPCSVSAERPLPRKVRFYHLTICANPNDWIWPNPDEKACEQCNRLIKYRLLYQIASSCRSQTLYKRLNSANTLILKHPDSLRPNDCDVCFAAKEVYIATAFDTKTNCQWQAGVLSTGL